MEKTKHNSKTNKADNLAEREKALKEATGIWKDKWPKSMSSTEIVREMRKPRWLKKS